MITPNNPEEPASTETHKSIIPLPGFDGPKPAMKYRPCRDIIQLDWEPMSSIGGIIIPEKAQQGMKLSFYSIPVLAAGPDCKVVKEGDNVLLPSEAILKVQYDGRVVYFCNEMKVLAVIEEAP